MKKSALVVALGAAGFLLALWKPAQLRPQPAQNLDKISQFRVVVGLKDTEAKSWQGSVSVTGGELAGLSGWRFSQKDRATPDGKFSFDTKIGQMENQLLTAFPFGQTDWGSPDAKRLIPEGLIVRVRGDGAGRVNIQTATGSIDFASAEVPFGKPLTVLGGNGMVERVPLEERLSESGTADDYAAVTVTPDGSRWVAWLAYQNKADTVMVSGGGKLQAVSGKGDHNSPAIASDGKGSVWVAWAENDFKGAFHIFARRFNGKSWSEPEKLTSAGSNIWPRLVSDGKGKIALVWQGLRNNQSVVLVREADNGRWGAERQMNEGPGNCWAPSAAYGGSKLWIAWDSYATGSYQIYVRQLSGPVERVTHGDKFSVRPSIVVMASGKPVVAWEESDALWGKDFTFLHDRRGTVIYKDRRIRVAYLEGSDWKETSAPVEQALPAGVRRFVQQPQLAGDSQGRLYLAFRCRTSAGNSRIDYWASSGRWETFLTRLDGKTWTPAIPMPSSVGRNSMIAALALRNGRVWLAWSTDNRPWPRAKYGDIDVYTTSLKEEGGAATLSGGLAIVAGKPAENPNPNEVADVKQIRAYRISMNGKQYRILRGDLHRHTELSGDGAGDGMLDDLYRYELDAVAFDYAYVADHQMGDDEEYNWWITQKSNDLYFMPHRFVPLYGYERSVWWPNGHRNVIWTERGKPVLPIGRPEAKGEANSGPIIYPYLRQTNGIATSHSSATEQGTDWRDNDPALEPIVEIYQGFESSYEHPGAPRAWKEGESKVHQGQRPAGYVWNAWAKGYKLGVQASSDHVSTHSSFACVLAEDFTREGMVDAMRKRHTYAATDNIVMDYRISTADAGTALMGDIFSTKSQPKLMVKVLGTAKIKQIDVIKNNTYIFKVNPNEKAASFEYVDNSVKPGESYYYVRAEQEDGQLAWSSPIWVTYQAR